MYSLAIYVTYAIQFYVPMSIIYVPPEDLSYKLWKDILIRIGLVTLTCGLAIAIPDLGDFIALVGASARIGFINFYSKTRQLSDLPGHFFYACNEMSS